MTEQVAERVSMLMDGELDQQKTVRLLDDLMDDEKLQHHWKCYHLIGDAIRNNLPENNNQTLASNIFKALEFEPVLTPATSSVVVYPSFVKPVAGLALAASVAAVTVIGFQWGDSGLWGMSDVSPQIAAVIPDAIPEPTRETFDLNNPGWAAPHSELNYSLNYPVNGYGNDIYVVPREPSSVNLVGFESN